MTKEQFIKNWSGRSDLFKADLEAVIATEIAKVKEVKPEELKGNCSTFDGSRLVDQVQPALNPISEAYEMGEKIRYNYWRKNSWIKKHSDSKVINQNGVIAESRLFDFIVHPEKWALHTEPTEQPAKPFDKDRFERMFRAVVASEAEIDFVFRRNETNYLLEQLDAYYATKNN